MRDGDAGEFGIRKNRLHFGAKRFRELRAGTDGVGEEEAAPFQERG